MSLDQMLTAYEQIHAKLAGDQIEAVGDDTVALEAAAAAAVAGAPARLRVELTNLADSAQRLSKMQREDADAVRRAFGDVSESLVTLLALEPSLREGWHVFECPMAKGYNKWVQASAKVLNPYMGQRMQMCGSDTAWND